jgi:thiamine monophosphate synthase
MATGLRLSGRLPDSDPTVAIGLVKPDNAREIFNRNVRGLA